ncbi:pentapeptide repeat-containing protein [Chitiniphilus shinanonensis]|uniref:pentapeptide repeat-containing protein n=2 Tax=Chitiniphilus shinanonensis TaxID=553088 RepID=UPI0003732451|nr:pentapeptide repeat-containing protein [Chitiniphilus shinanonensis]
MTDLWATLDKARRLSRVVTEADLTDLDARGHSLAHLTFHRVRLAGANLAGVDLSQTQFIDCDLSGVDFTQATLHTTQFLQCRLPHTRWAGGELVSWMQCAAPFSQWRGAVLNTSMWTQCELAGADFGEARLTRCVLLGGNADGLRLNGARLDQVALQDVDLAPVDLAGLDADASVLIGANLAGKALAGVRLARCTLQQADFSEADLSGAVLAGANCHRARFAGTRMPRLAGAGALMLAAQWQGVDARGADFSGSVFQEAALADCLLDDATLVKTVWRQARLERVSFAGCDLTFAGFDHAQGDALDFGRARLDHASLHNTAFTRVAWQGARRGSARGTDDFLLAAEAGLLAAQRAAAPGR